MRKPFLLGAFAFAAGAGVAHADPLLGLYAGAGAINSSVNNVLHTHEDISNNEWKAFAGIKPVGSPLGFEASYMDFGTRSNVFENVHGNAWTFDALGHIPLGGPFLSVYGKAGLTRTSLSGHTATGGVDDHGSQFTYGGGVQVRLGGVGARLEYEHLNIPNTDGANVVTLGVLFNFL
jgi:hypothetical protein